MLNLQFPEDYDIVTYKIISFRKLSSTFKSKSESLLKFCFSTLDHLERGQKVFYQNWYLQNLNFEELLLLVRFVRKNTDNYFALIHAIITKYGCKFTDREVSGAFKIQYQSASTCSKSTIETPEQCVKSVQS